MNQHFSCLNSLSREFRQESVDSLCHVNTFFILSCKHMNCSGRKIFNGQITDIITAGAAYQPNYYRLLQLTIIIFSKKKKKN